MSEVFCKCGRGASFQHQCEFQTTPVNSAVLPLRSHRLKTEENAWDAIERGDKTAEFRKNDRDYRVGDQLILERGTDEKRHLTLHRMVTHALYGPSFGIPEGYAMLSLGLCDCATHEIQQSQGAPTEEELTAWLEGYDCRNDANRQILARRLIQRFFRGTKQALQPTPVTITVNMREHRVEGGTISYERVAELAGKPGATHLTMTYHWTGPGRKSEISGSLIPGERALVRDGMHFCATNTSNA